MATEVLTTYCLAFISCILFTQTLGQLEDDSNLLWPNEELSNFGLPQVSQHMAQDFHFTCRFAFTATILNINRIFLLPLSLWLNMKCSGMSTR